MIPTLIINIGILFIIIFLCALRKDFSKEEFADSVDKKVDNTQTKPDVKAESKEVPKVEVKTEVKTEVKKEDKNKVKLDDIFLEAKYFKNTSNNLGIEECSTECKGNCVENGITGNAWCFNPL